MDFDQVTEHLYVGGRLEPGDWYILAELGITVNVNLQAEAQDRFNGTSPEVYLWLPTPDWYGPGVEAIDIGARFIDQMIRLGRKVYVHCNAGVGRAPTIAAGYLIVSSLTLEDALRVIKEKRPKASPTSGQLQQLQDFAEMWERRKRKR